MFSLICFVIQLLFFYMIIRWFTMEVMNKFWFPEFEEKVRRWWNRTF